MARNHVIGDGEKLLWHLSGDLKRVKSLTMGKPMIMGRRTYLSIGPCLARACQYRPDAAARFFCRGRARRP